LVTRQVIHWYFLLVKLPSPLRDGGFFSALRIAGALY